MKGSLTFPCLRVLAVPVIFIALLVGLATPASADTLPAAPVVTQRAAVAQQPALTGTKACGEYGYHTAITKSNFHGVKIKVYAKALSSETEKLCVKATKKHPGRHNAVKVSLVDNHGNHKVSKTSRGASVYVEHKRRIEALSKISVKVYRYKDDEGGTWKASVGGNP